MTEGFGLTDAQFWESGPQTGAITARLMRERFRGIELDGPRQLDLTERITLPLLACHVATLTDLSTASFEDHALVVSVDLDRNRARVAYADQRERAREVDDQDPTRPIPKGAAAQVHRLEMRELLGVPWEAGRHLFRVVLRDQVSNPLEVAFMGPAGDESELGAAKISPPAGSPFPAYEPLEASPPLPDDPGITLDVPRITLLDSDEPIVPLHAAFRLPVLESERLDPETEWDLPGPRPTALVGIALLLTRGERAFPAVFPLVVPSYEPLADGAEGPLATGYFALDLLRLRGIAAVPGTYFVYAFSGRVLGGPAPAALVSPEQIPEDA